VKLENISKEMGTLKRKEAQHSRKWSSRTFQKKWEPWKDRGSAFVEMKLMNVPKETRTLIRTEAQHSWKRSSRMLRKKWEPWKEQGLNTHESEAQEHFKRNKNPKKNRGLAFAEAKLKHFRRNEDPKKHRGSMFAEEKFQNASKEMTVLRETSVQHSLTKAATQENGIRSQHNDFPHGGDEKAGGLKPSQGTASHAKASHTP
jgi:hypothetical protein